MAAHCEYDLQRLGIDNGCCCDRVWLTLCMDHGARNKGQKLVGCFMKIGYFIGYWLLSHWECIGNLANHNKFWSAKCYNGRLLFLALGSPTGLPSSYSREALCLEQWENNILGKGDKACHKCMCVCACMRVLCVCKSACVAVYLCVFVWLCLLVCVFVYLYMYMHVYIEWSDLQNPKHF